MSRISSVQSKMARAAIGWGVRDLASAAKASTDTISRLERGEELKERTLDAIQRALEAAGIEFLPDDGVRLLAAKARAQSRSTGSGGSKKPTSAGKAAAPQTRKAGTQRKAAPATPTTKEAQLRALREQGAR